MGRLRVIFPAVVLCIFTSCMEVQALTVSLQNNQESGTPGIRVSNDHFTEEKSELYLIWADLDGVDSKESIWSIKEDGTWAKGLSPVMKEPCRIPPFSVDTVPLPPAEPPQGHRCFLIFMTVFPGSDPLKPQNWSDFSFWPLTREAAMERIPGQRFFLSSDAYTGGKSPNFSDLVPSEDTADRDESTEKPDIFELKGKQLIYANEQAKRVQVIDLSDPTTPKLSAWTSLSAAPREIYALEDYIYLLQSDDNETGISVLSVDSGKNLLTGVQELLLPGMFLESRRRGQVIYTVSEESGYYYAYTDDVKSDEVPIREEGPTLKVRALGIGANGLLNVSGEVQLTGTSPVVTIFPDYLVCAFVEGWAWGTTKVQVFDLKDPANPLRPLPPFDVLGYIPSEFHMDIQNDGLRLVYGPQDRSSGSTLAVYDLKEAQGPRLVGELSDIAPGESLFAVRFAGNRAYVVTYEQKDPLWVVDLSDESRPKILGELEVPGWSEQLFFHENRLFAVGVDDQPVEGEESRWVSRISASLFDVSDPSSPVLLDRFTPLTKETSYSYSEALEDERALLLDWENQYAAFPLESWETTAGAYLQILSFDENSLQDAGRVGSPVPISRAVPLESDLMAALGDQELFTVRWGDEKAEIIGSLELATNLVWLKKSDTFLWAAAMGRSGLYRLHRYEPSDLDTPQKKWILPQNYSDVLLEEPLAVFYDFYPFAFQVVDLNSEALGPRVLVEEKERQMPARSKPILFQNRLYFTERQTAVKDSLLTDPFIASPFAIAPEQWILRTWKLDGGNAVEEPQRVVPGEAVALTPQGYLLCREASSDSKLRLNLLSLNTQEVTLLETKDLDCAPWASTLTVSGDQLYVACIQEFPPYPPLLREDEQRVLAQEGRSTEIMKLLPEEHFSPVAQWTFEGDREIRAVTDDLILLSTHGMYYRMDVFMQDSLGIAPPYSYAASCEVYRLEAEPDLLHTLDFCPPAALSPEGVYTAEGFQGIRLETWNAK